MPRIDHDDFDVQFTRAVEAARAFAASMVTVPLPPSTLFLLEPNASYDVSTAMAPDERRFPDDSLTLQAVLPPMTRAEALAWLWRDGRVPAWIDVSVAAVDARTTYVRLACSGRFHGRREALYYQDGYPPFGIKSPRLPADWDERPVPRRVALPQFPDGLRFAADAT